MRKGIKLMNLLLCAAMLMGLFGCTATPEMEPEPIEGGTTTRRDPDAPHSIRSEEIVSLDTTFYLWDRWSSDDNHFFRFVIEPDATGAPMLRETERGVSCPADDALLQGVQKIVEDNKLVELNGLYDVTAGLPPEFFEYTTTVVYASGEKLTFTKNNEPEAPWAVALYDLFADRFAAQGETALSPVREMGELTAARFWLTENGMTTEYNGVNVDAANAIDGQTYLLRKSVFDAARGTTVETQTVAFPADYFEKLTGIVGGTELLKQYEFSYREHSDGYYGFSGAKDETEADSEDLSLTLHLTYADGSRVNIDTRKASEIEAARPLLEALLAYYDSIFH